MKKKPIPNPFLELSSHLRIKPFSTQEIVLDRANLSAINPGDLKFYPNLHSLYIPHNNLKILNNLDHNIRLTLIDARNNQIVDFDLKRQEFLIELFLDGNKLQDLEYTISRLLHLKNLASLDLRNNPLTLEKNYRRIVIQSIPSLKILDGLEIRAEERRPMTSISRHQPQQKRPQTILQCLIERPISTADSSVKLKAQRVRASSQLRKKRQMEEATVESRKQKEIYEAYAQIRIAPIPEGLDFYGKTHQSIETKKLQKNTGERPHSSLYIKRPVYTKALSLNPGEERFVQFNPDTPKIFYRYQNEIIYPQ